MTSPGSKEISRRKVAVTGQVQGVGFRPFVYRLATELKLAGYVLNGPSGVTIEIQGAPSRLEEFVRRLQGELPPLAQIVRLEQSELPIARGPGPFEIRPSEGGELTDAQITVDAAVCADCLDEMNDSADPRYRYPFINCTNCGPRYTIVTGIPYDRPNTTMADFAMCPLCRRQYLDPADRRFHAQPVACPRCGPAVWLVDPRGKGIDCPDAVAEAARLLRAGRIVAIKGLGGFHLACRADDDHAVRRLRARKRRDAKPFAVMAADLAHASRLVEMNDAAEKLLTGHLRPIVLLPARRVAQPPPPGALQQPMNDHPVAPSVAQGLDTLGVMLPYTPLHHLLFAQEGLAELPLVMTSGNYSEEPLVKDNDAAIAHLGRIADAILLHNRRIERRVDDSVVQAHRDGSLAVLRRARGYAPQPVRLEIAGGPSAKASVLATGGELKSTICLLKGGRAVLSEHIGDLKDGRAYRHFIDTINHLERLFEVQPEVVVADLHPQYLSTEYALKRHRGELPGRPAIPILRVQHHHAHVVACLAENGRGGPAIGLACDGTGYGDDGAVWGCEILRADLAGYERLGHLRYLPLLGGDAAAAQTWRPAISALYDAFGPECIDMPAARQLAGGADALETAIGILQAGANCPPSSSLGRWFDAVAGLCGVAQANAYEGQAPMMLEAAILGGVENAYDFRILDVAGSASSGGMVQGTQPGAAGPHWASPGGESFLIDLRPMVQEIVNDLSAAISAGVIAARFHNTVAALLLEAARKARELTALNVVALSGGCFANRYLTWRLTRGLAREGFEVLTHRTVPCNDGCVALGQALCAAARLAAGQKMGSSAGEIRYNRTATER